MMVHVKVLFENIFISKPSFSDTALFCILFKYLTDLLKSIKAWIYDTETYFWEIKISGLDF